MLIESEKFEIASLGAVQASDNEKVVVERKGRVISVAMFKMNEEVNKDS